MYAILTKLPTCFVLESRALQDQLLNDGRPVGLVDIRGRRNYDCIMRDGFTCEDGRAARCPHVGSVRCALSAAEMRAAASPLVSTNYDKWTSARKYRQGLQHFQQVVFDEGDLAPDALSRAMQVTLHEKEIRELCCDFPPQPDEFVNWKPWAQKARAEAEAELQSAQHIIRCGQFTQADLRRVNHYRNLTKRLTTIATARPENWVVDQVEKGYQFDAVQPGVYSEGVLLLKIPSILVVSGTLRPKTLHMMGVPTADMDFYEFDTDFNPERCPIYYIPTMRVDAKATSLAPVWIKLDQIAAPRTDRKGLVQTISYARRNEVLAASRFSRSMIINPKGEPSMDTLEDFRHMGPGAILVSPSFGRGYDFAYTDAEWQFICKIPFLDGRSKIMKARQAADKSYGPYLAWTKLIQICGRVMRAHDDQGESFIVDMHMEWFWKQWGHFATKAFKRFFKRVDTVPRPPPRLEV